ncbi:MAG: hypothetical protein ABIJ34_01505 [archaeon]
MAKKKVEMHWLATVSKIFSSVFDTIIEHSDEKVREIKKRVVHYVVVYGIFVMALFFIAVGLIKYLAELYIFASEGIAFMVVGSIIIVLLAAYSLIQNI